MLLIPEKQNLGTDLVIAAGYELAVHTCVSSRVIPRLLQFSVGIAFGARKMVA